MRVLLAFALAASPVAFFTVLVDTANPPHLDLSALPLLLSTAPHIFLLLQMHCLVLHLAQMSKFSILNRQDTSETESSAKLLKKL